MRVPRFRLRTLMMAVAVVGLLLGLGVLTWRRALDYRALATLHLIHWRSNDVQAATWVAGARERAAFHLEMMEKYSRAARYPWLSVPTHPPWPE
jgi:hypothetical protein